MLAIDSIVSMATLVIRKLDDRTKSKLRVQAAHHKRSMEEEAREILRASLSQQETKSENLGQAIYRRFSDLGGVELELPDRGPMREPLRFDL
jgi:plasmid stability protein